MEDVYETRLNGEEMAAGCREEIAAGCREEMAAGCTPIAGV
jgi:hypothetical protein